jgi:CheY-like chemotaxis protein
MWLVALTGWGQEAYRQESKNAGFDHHLVKPVSRDDLLNLLAEIGQWS